MNDRPTWTLRFTRVAEQWAEYSTCTRSHVGAVIYRPDSKALVSIGYNDTPKGWENCIDGGCKRCSSGAPTSLDLKCTCIHAEMNAVLLAGRHGHPLEGCHMVSTRKPCPACRPLLAQVGIVLVTVDGEYKAPMDWQGEW